MDGALFFEEVPSVPAVYLVLDDARGRMAQTRLLIQLSVTPSLCSK
ncbi:hypothetical protein B835_1764 [Enterococcus mundtii 3F]|nr:hypothetical protein [Enterococcus mundtii 3F]